MREQHDSVAATDATRLQIFCDAGDNAIEFAERNCRLLIEIDDGGLLRIAPAEPRQRFCDCAIRNGEMTAAKRISHARQCPVRERISVQPFMRPRTFAICSWLKKSSSFTFPTGYCGRMKSFSYP